MFKILQYLSSPHLDVLSATLLVYELAENCINFLGIPIRRRARLPASLEGKVAIITGANTGIGKQTAKVFAQLGAQVILGCRNLEKASEAVKEIREELKLDASEDRLIIIKLDLSCLASVREFVKDLKSRVGKIDYLINNAGVLWCPHTVTVDGHELQLATNVLGHFLLTQLLIDLLLRSSAARIVNVSSVAYIQGRIHFDNINLEGNYNAFRAYSQSKLAIVLLTREMARRLEGTSVSVYCLHPGVIQTQLTRHMRRGWRLLLCTNNPLGFIDPSLGAQTTLYCALQPGIKNGAYYENCRRAKLLSKARDDKAARRLWSLVLHLCQLTEDHITKVNRG